MRYTLKKMKESKTKEINVNCGMTGIRRVEDEGIIQAATT